MWLLELWLSNTIKKFTCESKLAHCASRLAYCSSSCSTLEAAVTRSVSSLASRFNNFLFSAFNFLVEELNSASFFSFVFRVTFKCSISSSLSSRTLFNLSSLSLSTSLWRCSRSSTFSLCFSSSCLALEASFRASSSLSLSSSYLTCKAFVSLFAFLIATSFQ